MKVVILAGGYGRRVFEHTKKTPKPMIKIGKAPIFFHILNIYSAFGFSDFILALGYKAEVFNDWCLNYSKTNPSFSVTFSDGEIDTTGKKKWNVRLVDTGLDLNTGGRLKRLKKWIGDETFMLTYGDGLSNVNVRKLVEFHKEHKKLATVTAVNPPPQFGYMQLDESRVVQFAEKAQQFQSWISGGFFVLEPEVLNFIDGDMTVFEEEPLENLVREGELMAYQHRGFWHPMDTLKDYHSLQKIWETGDAPWQSINGSHVSF